MVATRHREYETVYIVRPDVEEGVKDDIKERIEEAIDEHDGEILDFDDWGMRDLAYEIEGEAEEVSFTRGEYQCYTYRAPSGVVSKVERQLRLVDTVIKFMTIKLGEDVAREAS